MLPSLLIQYAHAYRYLHSFPTRRSSDLFERGDVVDEHAQNRKRGAHFGDGLTRQLDRLDVVGEAEQAKRLERATFDTERIDRSEERRVGKECRSRWLADE